MRFASPERLSFFTLLVLLIALALVVVQILTGPYTITWDGPSHFYTARVAWDLWHNARSVYRTFYAARSFLIPNWGGLLAAVAAERVAGSTFAAERMTVIGCMLANLTGLAILLRSLRCANIALGLLLLFPFVINGFIFTGFFGFSLAFALSCVLLGLLMQPFTGVRAGLAVVLGLLTYVFHPMPVALAVAIAFVVLLAKGLLAGNYRQNASGLITIAAALTPALLMQVLAPDYMGYKGGAHLLESPRALPWLLSDLAAGGGWLAPVAGFESQSATFFFLVVCSVLLLFFGGAAKREWLPYVAAGALVFAGALLIADDQGTASFIKSRIGLYALLALAIPGALYLSSRIRAGLIAIFVLPFLFSFGYLNWRAEHVVKQLPTEIGEIASRIKPGSTLVGLVAVNEAGEHVRVVQHLADRIAEQSAAVSLTDYEGLMPHFPLALRADVGTRAALEDIRRVRLPGEVPSMLAAVQRLSPAPDYLVLVWNTEPDGPISSVVQAEIVPDLFGPEWTQVARVGGSVRIFLWQRRT